MSDQSTSQSTQQQCRFKMVVYCLIDPRDDEVRYVGKSVRSIHRRLRRHLAPTYLKANTHKDRWIRCLLNIGLEPRIEVLEQCDSVKSLSEREIYWIAHYLALGARLTNGTPGGDGGGSPHTEESRAKISAALKGKPKSAEHRRRVGLAQRGRKISDETRAKLSAIQSSRPRKPHSESHLLNMSRARGGRPFVDQHGNRYETMKEASRLLGVNQGSISRVLHGTRLQIGGYMFRFIETDLRVREMPVKETATS